MSDYVTAAEAAEQLGCSETHIRRLIERGDLNGTKKNRRWRILRSDLDMVALDDDGSTDQPTDSHDRLTDRPTDRRQRPTDRPTEPPTAWRDDLLAQVARLEAEKDTIRGEASRREEASKARIIDLERAATVRESRIADLEDTIGVRESRIVDLAEQVSVLEAKVREILEKGQDEALQLANRIADLVDRQQAADARIYELQPVAERVPMLEAAVDEKDAALFDRERRLSDMRADIEAIASRPVAGPVFRYLTRGKLRR